jgi:N-methylhydantoinase A
MYRISVDVGGTFTDVIVADPSGKLTLGKSLTTPQRSFDGFYGGVEDAARILGTTAQSILTNTSVLIYGTTRATNAIVEGKVAKTALIITQGFPDVLLYRQGGKERPFFLHFDYPRTYIPRKYTFEAPERVNSEGQIETPLDEAAVRAHLKRMRRIGIEAIAVCLLWSIANDAHEKRIGELIAEELPGVPFTLSCELNPIVREYPRASASAIDASLKPLMQQHLRMLKSDLEGAGFKGELLVSASSGGVVHIEDAVEKPIYMTKSGPAMAPLAGIAYSAAEDLGDDVLIVDTGGTTFDVSLVRGGIVKYTRDTWLLGKYIGHNLGVSTVDVRSIGAGGGSIAWVDVGGLLRVGPESAGSVPGPACYGNGGAKPTVTDASVVLGYIDPDNFLGGRMKLDVAAARRAVETLCPALGLSVEAVALGILRIAGEQMIKAIEEITVHDGINPREAIIIAGGGAAGLNILPIADALGCPRVLLPATAGGLSACGAQFSDIVATQSISGFTDTGVFDSGRINGCLDKLDADIQSFIDRLKTRGLDRIRLEYFVEARYAGQHHELEIPVPVKRFASAEDVAQLRDVFDSIHERLYTVRDAGSEVEFITWKVRLTAELDKPAVVNEPLTGSAAPKAAKTVQAYFQDVGLTATPVYLAAQLKPGDRMAGPAIIAEPTTTVVVYPGMRATLTAGRNYLLETTAAARLAVAA